MNPELSRILEPEKGPLKGMKQGHAGSRDEVDVCLYARAEGCLLEHQTNISFSAGKSSRKKGINMKVRGDKLLSFQYAVTSNLFRS
ncbi:hypothetical protein NPIL_214871 [Nephila pilipes]|uniref:Uncharacterized protein n=1 Tax=Nephila pilipes TaxID=299642 RepID=A0A8X6N8M3_NEPPI|nr:hypothetical protein NPIL_214871 [Nephila pilipes]